MLLLSEKEIRSAVTLAETIPAIEEAFVACTRKKANLPGVIHLDVPEQEGEVHVKGAYLHGAQEFVIKVASGFYQNRKRGLPAGSGLMMVFSAETGFPLAILLDNAYLTDLRTAAAGAVAAKYMALDQVEQVAILGAGERADRIIADSVSQCVKFGEIHHAVVAGVLREEDIDGELGQVILGEVLGRKAADEITVCDLTGVGVQDAAIAGLVYQRARARRLGREID